MTTNDTRPGTMPSFSTLLRCAVLCLLSLAYLNASVSKDRLVLFKPGSSELMMGLLACFLFIFLLKNEDILSVGRGRPLIFRILGIAGSLVLAAISLAGRFDMGESYITAERLFGSPVLALSTCLYLAGGTCAYWLVVCLVDRYTSFLAGPKEIRIENALLKRILGTKHIFGGSLAVMALAWLPHLLIAYPAHGSPDSWSDLAMYWHQKTWTTMHPIIYTLLLGKMTDLGTALGRTEIGFFIITLLQTGATLLIFAYTLKLMDFFGIRRSFIGLAFIFYTLLPTFVAFAPSLKIDVFFCAFFLLVFDELAVYLFRRDEFFSRKRHWLLLVIGVCGLFFRYNGYYILLVLFLIIFVRELVFAFRDKASIRRGIIILLLILAPTLGMQKATHALNDAYGLVNITERVKYSLSIQQISRCVVDHRKELTSEEVEKLSKYFSLAPKKFAKHYRPYNFDGMKEYFIAPDGDVADYFRLWAHFIKKYPESCLNATLTQNYFLFDLRAENTHYYIGLNRKSNIESGDVFYKSSRAKRAVMQRLVAYYNSFDGLPVVGLFTSQAIYSVILFSLLLGCLAGKDRRAFLLVIALALVLGITFVGPAVYGHPRYTYPLIYCLPMSLTAAALCKRDGE